MKDHCYLLRNVMDGGGNMATQSHIIVRRNAALGDVLSATVIADRLSEKGYSVEFQSHPSTHCLLRRVGSISRIAETGGYAHVNLDGAYETNPARKTLHFSEMWFSTANAALRSYGIDLGPPYNARPRLVLSDMERALGQAKLSTYPRPWVFLCPRSNHYVVRQVPDGIWQEAAAKINGTCFWVGSHPGPPGIVDLQVRHIDNLILWMSAADLLISVDTGPLHIGAALGLQILAINQSSSPSLHLSDQVDFMEIDPEGLTCLNCQANVCPKNSWTPPCQNISPQLIATWANRKLSCGKFGQDVTAVISVYRPDVDTLNRCLRQVVDQVQEVIVCSDKAGVVPHGTMQHNKIRFVQSRLFDSGYGRKQNVAARHSCGRYLLLLNDDVFLEPNAVERMRTCFSDGVGMVSNLLRYPDGTIYHAGKRRAPGVRGWGHINHRQYEPDIKEPAEMENVCGACVMVRREAFYQIGGFDEEFYLYAEDDDMSLRIRHAGWKILFTPHSSGIHLEHQSTSKTGPIIQHLNSSNAVFGRKWGRYLDWNINRVPGDFEYLKA